MSIMIFMNLALWTSIPTSLLTVMHKLINKRPVRIAFIRLLIVKALVDAVIKKKVLSRGLLQAA